MSYDASKVAGGKGNFSLNQNFEAEGVDLTILTVDFIVDVSAETGVSDISLSAAVADDIVAVTLSGVRASNALTAAWIAATVVVELIVSKASALTM